MSGVLIKCDLQYPHAGAFLYRINATLTLLLHFIACSTLMRALSSTGQRSGIIVPHSANLQYPHAGAFLYRALLEDEAVFHVTLAVPSCGRFPLQGFAVFKAF